MRFQAFIHTIQIGTRYEIIPIEEAYQRPYVVKPPSVSFGYIRYIINPNKYGQPHKITSLPECIKTIEAIIDDLSLTDYEWRIERVDVTIESESCYDELYKFNCYLKELFALRIKCKNAYRVIGDDMRKRSTVVKNERYELEIYNKHLESGDSLLPQTRCEFRYKRLHRRKMDSWQDAVIHSVEMTQKTLCELPRFIGRLEELKERLFLETCQRESAPGYEGRICNLSSFAIKYADYIYTRASLKTLHTELAGGDFDSWLYRFRKKGHVLSLINRGGLKWYCRQLFESLVVYIENAADAPCLEMAG